MHSPLCRIFSVRDCSVHEIIWGTEEERRGIDTGLAGHMSDMEVLWTLGLHWVVYVIPCKVGRVKYVGNPR